MIVSILQADLSKALTTVLRFTSSKVQLPILADILLSTNKNKLTVSATNLEMSISVSLGAKVDEDGSIALPAKVIAEMVANLKPGQISLTAEKETLKILSQDFESTLVGMDPTDFPKVPVKIEDSFVSFDKDLMLNSLEKVLFSVSNDETRPLLNGVLFVFSKSDITLVSTDGFRLSKKVINLKSGGLEKNIIIPRNALAEVVRLLPDTDKILMSFNDNEKQVIFEIGKYVLTSRIIEGEFPSFEKIIPKTSEVSFTADRDDFLGLIKVAGVLARDSANVIKMSFGKTNINIYSESQRSGNQKAGLDVKYDQAVSKDSFEVAFNYKFIESFLGVVEDSLFSVQLTNSSSPCIFIDKSDNNYLHLIMPVRI